MPPFKRLVLKSQLQITLHELEQAGAHDIAYVERSDGQVEITAVLTSLPPRRPGNLRFGGTGNRSKGGTTGGS